MFKKILLISIFLSFLINLAHAEKINSVIVDGNKRLSKESIIVFGNIIVNNDYNDQSLNIILKDLYSTNFFQDINLSIKNNVLYIKVVENPIIEDLKINGISNKKLEETLLDLVQLKNRKSYIESTFTKDLTLIKNVVKSNGYYFAKVKTSIIKNKEKNSIKLIYDIDLGKKAKISEISFIGDKKIKDRKLSNVITSEEARFWKFLSNRSYVDNKRINLDKRLLTGYYKNNGFYNVIVEESFVEFKDNGSFKLIFNIESGKKFNFNKFYLSLPDDFDPKYFKSINKLLSKYENQLYSLDKVNKILNEIDKIALSKKYEFIDANITENIIDGNKLDIKIDLVETDKFYVEKINILGNSFTLEEVIRNSFIVDEGDPYNEILFNKSVNKIKSKNIFSSVESKISDGSKSGLKVIDLTVVEKPTGEISLGAGFGTGGGTIGGGIKENNFLGKNIKLDTNLTLSENSLRGVFIYSKPNFGNTDNTLYTSLRSTTTDNLTNQGYETTNLGFSLATSFEQYENLFYKPEISAASEDLKTNSTATSNLKKQEGSYLDLYYNHSFIYDLRNRSYKATDGYKTIFYQEIPLSSETAEFINAFEYVKYQSLPSEMVGRIAFMGKSAHTLSSKDVRISKRLYVSQNNLRGFEKGKVGPFKNNNYVGGNYISAVNLSTTLPQVLPSFQNTDVSLFLDAANIWGVDYDASLDDKSKIRSSMGVAVDFRKRRHRHAKKKQWQRV